MCSPAWFGAATSDLPVTPIAHATHAATTYYVRTDGGDASQCTGRADAAYPGSGTGQACAWKHPFYALARPATSASPAATSC